jgi:serine O-acetyltransferase
MLDHLAQDHGSSPDLDGQGQAFETITSKDDYRRYLAADLASHGLARWRRRDGMRQTELSFQRLLRRLEYLENCRRDPVGRVLAVIARWRYKRRSVLLGFTIPRNAFGPGLSIAHYGSIVVNGNARIGRNCRIHSDVNIGEANGLAPLIGNNVYIGPGAKIFGPIRIGDGVAIGANAVVNRDVPSGVSVGGIPARVISQRGSKALVIDGCSAAGL